MTEWVSRAVAARALTHGILKLMAKINARPSALVNFAVRISEIPTAAVPEALAPKVELTRLPPVPYRVFNQYVGKGIKNIPRIFSLSGVERTLEIFLDMARGRILEENH